MTLPVNPKPKASDQLRIDDRSHIQHNAIIDIEARAEGYDLTIAAEPKKTPEEIAHTNWERRFHLVAAAVIAGVFVAGCLLILYFSKDKSLSDKVWDVLAKCGIGAAAFTIGKVHGSKP